MEKEKDDSLLVVISEEGRVRGYGLTAKLKIEDLSDNINQFLEKMSVVLQNSPEKIGNFEFSEFEVNAELSATGSLALLGTGGGASAKGGLKFVFRRSEGRQR